jgi:hypothetical protein
MDQVVSLDPATAWRFVPHDAGHIARRTGRVRYCITQATQPPFRTLCGAQRFVRAPSLVLTVARHLLCESCGRQATDLEVFLQPQQGVPTP